MFSLENAYNMISGRWVIWVKWETSQGIIILTHTFLPSFLYKTCPDVTKRLKCQPRRAPIDTKEKRKGWQKNKRYICTHMLVHSNTDMHMFTHTHTSRQLQTHSCTHNCTQTYVHILQNKTQEPWRRKYVPLITSLFFSTWTYKSLKAGYRLFIWYRCSVLPECITFSLYNWTLTVSSSINNDLPLFDYGRFSHLLIMALFLLAAVKIFRRYLSCFGSSMSMLPR